MRNTFDFLMKEMDKQKPGKPVLIQRIHKGRLKSLTYDQWLKLGVKPLGEEGHKIYMEKHEQI
jgi:hypothetical protein